MRNHHIGNNGWADIGQHFSVFPDGAVVTGRPLNRTPACIYHANAGGVCFENVGAFDAGRDQMPAAQRDSILRATAAVLFVEATEGDWARIEPGQWIHQSLIALD